MYWHRGFARKAELKFSEAGHEPKRHITNLNQALNGADHFWSFGRVGEALRAEHGFGAGHMDAVEARMRRISLFAFQAMRKPGGDVGDGGGGGHDDDDGGGGAAPTGLSSWQFYTLDWAMEPSGEVSLLEYNAASAYRHVPSGDDLTPRIWSSMIELVGLAQSAPARSLRERALPRSYAGWRLLHNEAARRNRRARPSYNACSVPAEE